MDSVFLLIDIFILRIILLLMPKEGLILKKIIKILKILKKRIVILNAEAELEFINLELINSIMNTTLTKSNHLKQALG